jgi:dephospho-CoA kinase
MLRVGLTGGIGGGKSTVAVQLVTLGAVLVDADRLARQAVEKGTPGFDAVVAEFGPAVVSDGGTLDRAALARIVFSDEERRHALNAIVHPGVAARREELLAQAPADAVVVEDIPLLVETGLAPAFHLVLVVHAPAETRVRRLMAERGMDPADAWSRVRAQADDTLRRTAADVVLDNSGPPEHLAAQVSALWSERLVPFERNVRTRTIAARPRTPALVPYDTSWPDQAARLAARIVHAIGRLGLGVEHVGSTAIPGIRAKDVIDLQLAVQSLGDADAARAALEDAGYPLVPGIGRDNPKPVDPDPEHWRKRLHGSADPGRVVNLHIREQGSAGWRYALLFRDWLRAVPQEAAAYEAEKLRLASIHQTTAEYAEAKEPWFDAALPRADTWARAAGWEPT